MPTVYRVEDISLHAYELDYEELNAEASSESARRSPSGHVWMPPLVQGFF